MSKKIPTVGRAEARKIRAGKDGKPSEGKAKEPGPGGSPAKVRQPRLPG